jgi:hypothetical protein
LTLLLGRGVGPTVAGVLVGVCVLMTVLFIVLLLVLHHLLRWLPWRMLGMGSMLLGVGLGVSMSMVLLIFIFLIVLVHCGAQFWADYRVRIITLVPYEIIIGIAALHCL